jgi:hypothetical protein
MKMNDKINMKMNNNMFFAWFLGFCDAEANFQTTKFKRINKNGIVTSIGLKYSFHIGLSNRDKTLLEFIHIKLNNKGKIYEYNNKKEVHLAIVKIEDLKWLIENIFSKYPLLTNSQASRYERLKLGITKNLKRLNPIDSFESFFENNKDIKPDFINCSSDYIDN